MRRHWALSSARRSCRGDLLAMVGVGGGGGLMGGKEGGRDTLGARAWRRPAPHVLQAQFWVRGRPGSECIDF